MTNRTPEIDEQAFDDRLTDYLIAYEARAAGELDTLVSLPAETELPAEALGQLQRMKSCVDLLQALQDEQRAESILEQRAESVQDDGSPARTRRIGRFEILAELGAGGFGIVYKAWDPKIEREVALKIPRFQALASHELKRRFEQEARAAAKLDHPNIVPVLDAGTDGLLPYIVSAYYQGVTLAAWLEARREPIAPRDAAEIVRQLADALNHAHARGVLHRDIKPSNILLISAVATSTPEALVSSPLTALTPRLMDFGLAKLSDGKGDLTQSGAMLGTIRYMSPEQAQGKTAEVGNPADIYGLGAVLYELLLGQPPFQGVTDADNLRQVLFEEPARLRALRADVPADLEAICLCALEKDPRRRYATASGMAEDLERYLAGRPTLVRPLSPIERSIRWARRRPAIAALVAVCVVALTTIIGGTLTYNVRLRNALADVRTHAQQLRAESYAIAMTAAQSADDNGNVTERDRILDGLSPPPGEEDLREFSWHQLKQRDAPCVMTLKGHTGDVYGVAFSPTGRLVATAGKDCTVRLWDPMTGKEQAALTGHPGEVGELAFFDHGRLLASAGDDGSIRIWNVESRQLERVFEPQAGSINSLAATISGESIAAGCQDGRVRLWNGATGELVWASDQAEPVQSVAFTADGATLTASYSFLKVRTWDAPTGAVLESEQILLGDAAASIQYSSTGRTLIAAERGKRICAFDRDVAPKNWRQISQTDLPLRELSAHGLSISPVSNSFAVGTRSGSVYAYTVRGQREFAFAAHPGRVWKTAWSPNGRLLASAAADGMVKIWDLEAPTSAAFFLPRLNRRQYKCITVPDNDGGLVALTEDGFLHEWDRKTGTVLSVIQSSKPGDLVTLAPGGARIAISTPGDVNRWSKETAWPDYAENLDLDGSTCMATGAGLFVGQRRSDRAVMVFDTKSMSQVGLIVPERPVSGLAVADDGSRIAVATSSGMEIWRASPLRREKSFPLGQPLISHQFIFTRDGRQIVGCDDGEALTIWDIESGVAVRRFNAAITDLKALAQSHDGRTLASIAFNRGRNCVQLWNFSTGAPLTSLEVLPGPRRVEFSPDDKTLVAMGNYLSGWIIEWSIEQRENHAFDDPDVPPKRTAIDLGMMRRQTLVKPVDPRLPPATDQAASTSTKSAFVLDPWPPVTKEPWQVEIFGESARLFRAAGEYARREGFATAYPTYNFSGDSQTRTAQIVLVRGGPAKSKLHVVTANQIENARQTSLVEYDGQKELIVETIKACDGWANYYGYTTAIPTLYVLRPSRQLFRYELVSLADDQCLRGVVPMAKPDDDVDWIRVFPAIHRVAVERGFATGYPTFNFEKSGEAECIFFKPGSVEVRDVPIDELRTFVFE